MNTNVDRLEFRKNTDTGHLGITVHTTDMGDKYPYTMYFTRDEIIMAVECLRGTATVYPFFSDIAYLVQFGLRGMRIVHLDPYITGRGGKYDELWATFPGKEIVPQLEVYLESGDAECAWGYNAYDFSRWQRVYGAHIARVYHDGYGTNAGDIMRRDLHDAREERLVNCMMQLEEMASNASDGNLVEIHISLDERPSSDEPCSYYFEVHGYQGRILNGGIIAHRARQDGKPIDRWSYSLHT